MSDATEQGAFGAKFSRRRGASIDESLAEVLRHVIADAQARMNPLTTTVADIGAGAGGYVLMASKLPGVLAVGVDGTPGIEQISGGFVREVNLASVQLTNWVFWTWEDRFKQVKRTTLDVAWFIEVGEHIPKICEQIVFWNLWRSNAATLVVSWATPGQRGRGHVNCRSSEYVANRLGESGYVIDDEATANARRSAGRGWDRKLMILRRA
jgi:hypothetical protein